MQTMDLRVTNGASAGAWIEPRLESESSTITSLVPEGYEAYVRIVHPAKAGRMDFDELDALSELLAAHTGAPGHCYFGLRVSLGWEESFAADELKPLLELPAERDHIVLAGRLAAVDKLIRNWAGRSGGVVVKREAPNLIWPADRSWFVCSEVDFDSTLVGGSAELIEAIVESPALEAWEVEPTNSLASDADKISRARQRQEAERKQARTLEFTDGAAAGAWIEPRLGGEIGSVANRVPEGYEAYVRIFHPAYNQRSQPVRWDVIAKAMDRAAHPLMQWESLIRGFDWDAPAPSHGKMDFFSLDVLCAILTGHTAKSERCCFALRAIEGWEDWFQPDAPKPALERIAERDYIVLAGPVDAVGEIALAQSESESEPGREAPTLIWPADRSWFVTSSGGRGSTLVGGSAELIAEILEFPMLEAWQIEPTDSVASNADKINDPKPRLHLPPGTLELTDGAAAGAWIAPRLGRESYRVVDKVPEGYEQYAWMRDASHAELDTLFGILAAHTTAPDRCYFTMFVGSSWEDSFFSPDEPQPLLTLRPFCDYLVFEGPLAAVDQVFFSWAHHSGEEVRARRTPEMIWPADRRWFVNSRGGRGSILVGGSAELIKAIVESPALEAWRAEPSDSPAFDADESTV